MKYKDVKEMSDAELARQVMELGRERLRLKVQGKTGELKTTARIRQIRRDVARFKTELTARAAKAQGQAAEKTA
ncbi:MAG: 50S ribosomal protein L29 [Victivallales bacterium]|nr:50S ribosomal protein L29 [Victivallales bacterium]